MAARPGAAVALAGLMGPPLVIVTVLAILYAQFGELEILGRILSGITAAAAGLLIAVVAKMAMPLFAKRWSWPTAIAILAFIGVAIMRWPLPYVFVVLAPIAVALAWYFPAAKTGKGGKAMNDNPLLALFGYFALLSLFAVGGANAAIPEMHRIAVEVMHWMNDRQFADSFAIAQLSPGPNVIIVTLIGYHVAGFAGAAVATVAMCGPTCVLSFFAARTWDRFKDAPWRIAVQAGLVPVSLGLIAASAFVLARAADKNAAAGLVTAATVAGRGVYAHQSAVVVCHRRCAGSLRLVVRFVTRCTLRHHAERSRGGREGRWPRGQVLNRQGADFTSRCGARAISTAAWC